MSQNALTEIISNNYAKIKNLREKGIDPFPHRFAVTHKIAEARTLPVETRVVCAGRMMLMRVMGKATFGQVKDGTGKIQFYVKKDVVAKKPMMCSGRTITSATSWEWRGSFSSPIPTNLP